MLGGIFARNSKETAGLTLSQVKTITASTIKSKLNPSTHTNTDKLCFCRKYMLKQPDTLNTGSVHKYWQGG